MKTRGVGRRPRADAVHAAPRAARASRSPAVAGRTHVKREPTMCERCGAVYRNKTWRAGQRTRSTSLVGVGWTRCPACVQVEGGEYFGRVRVIGAVDADREAEIRRRVERVEERARYTQPERRTVRIDRERAGLEILTTSQKLAHRIARELEKAFGGRADYVWSDREGSLDATWDPAAPAVRALAGGRRRLRRKAVTTRA